MKSLNRTLSLVLVLVMVFGLFGVASAASFSDASKIQYSEAVGVMTGIGAINGYTDGTFGPTATITREEAAKMVTYAVLGPTVAKTLSVTATGFSDVDAARWSAPYVAYCVSQGIINGMGDGTFAPTANVTGYQLAKMMLCAAGYGKASEFTGASWELNVAVAAHKYKVFTGSKAANFSAAATREEAALYVFNAITKVPTVTYSKVNEAYTPVANATVGQFNADGYYEIAESVYTTLTKETSYSGGTSGYYWKLGSTYISDFVGSAAILATSMNGTSLANLTTATSTSYIKYQADTTVTYYLNDYKVNSIEAALAGVAAAKVTGEYVFVGSLATGGTIYVMTAPLAAAGNMVAGTNCTAVITFASGFDSKNGVIVKFTDSDLNGKYDAVSFVKKAAIQLSAAPSTTTVGSVTTVVIPGVTAGTNANYISYPAGLAKGDVVLYYTSADGMIYVEKASVFAGTMTGYTAGVINKIVVDSTTYKLSDLTFNGASLNGALAALNTAVAGKAGTAFYLDNGGNVVGYYVTTATIAADKLVYIKDASSTAALGGTFVVKALAVFSDGTSSVITVKKVGAADATPATATTAPVAASALTTGVTGSVATNTFYTYVVNTDGTYTLTANEVYNALTPAIVGRHFAAVDPGANNTCTAFGVVGNIVLNDTYATITKGQANFLTVYTGTGAGTVNAGVAGSYLANSSTVFVIWNAATSTYKTYTGIANVPSTTVFGAGKTVDVAMNAAGTYAALVVVSDTSFTDNSSATVDVAFVCSGPTYHYDATNPYWTVSAIINGVPGELKMPASTTLTAGNTYRITAYTSGVVSAADTAAPVNAATAAVTAMTVSDSTLALYTAGPVLANSFVLSSAVKCFVLNTTAGTVSAVDAASLPTVYTAGTYTVQTVATSTTNSAIAYVFVIVS